MMTYDCDHAWHPGRGSMCLDCDHPRSCHPPEAYLLLKQHAFEETAEVPTSEGTFLWRPGQHVMVRRDRQGSMTFWLKFNPAQVNLNGDDFIDVALSAQTQ